MKLLISLTIILTLFNNKSTCQVINDLKPTIILISLDGFHPSYLERHKDSNLNTLAKEGVRAKWMTPVFPTKTFPNHYSIVTGLYPAHHGIVHNTIYDPVFNSMFSLSNREEVQNGRWWWGEPVWVTAEKNGIRTAPFFFPGSEAAIKSIRPTYWLAYDGSLPNTDRVGMVLKLLDLPAAERPQFFSIYFSDLDDAGHNFSLESKQVNSAIESIDSIIGQLINGLKLRNIYDQVNIIIVSDHGMAEVNPANIIILDDYFDIENAEHIIWDEQLTGILAKAGKEHILYKQLKSSNPPHINIYHTVETPKRFHYDNWRRVPGIICLADEGWLIMSRSDYEYKKRENKLPRSVFGAHGYDNQLESMRAIFLAHGSAFKKKIVVDPFENIHLYNLMTRILGISPAKNNGNMDLINKILN